MMPDIQVNSSRVSSELAEPRQQCRAQGTGRRKRQLTVRGGAGGKQAKAGPGKGKGAIKAAACPICEFQTTPPHDGRTHRNQKKKGPFSAAELKEKGLVKV